MPDKDTYQAEVAIVDGEDDGNTADTTETKHATGRLRTMTSIAEIDSTITHPGSVRINVKGAYIVDTPEEPGTPANISASAGNSYYETKDIRLPNHTAVVSHIAVDVSFLLHFAMRHSIVWSGH